MRSQLPSVYKALLSTRQLYSASSPRCFLLLHKPPLQHFSTSLRTMADPSKTKTDAEWQAVLSPEQVGLPCFTMSPCSPFCSSVSFARRGQRLPARESTTNSMMRGSTPAPHVTPHSTRAPPSSKVGVAGQPFTMVWVSLNPGDLL